MTSDLSLANDIAIIGLAGRFPGSRSISQFWSQILDGVETITFLTDEELTAAGVQPRLLADPAYVPAGGFLTEFDGFDAEFFRFNPREALISDPQHRIFLECAWEALEDAGYDLERFEGRVAVFAGAGKNNHAVRVQSDPELQHSVNELQIASVNDVDMLATQAAYKLNLKGPCITVQTACSTSLVAVHLGCKSLLMQEADMVLAGGVSIKFLERAGYLYQEGSILSSDGHCRPFDAQANGTVPGDGAALVVLKRLEDALSDGDSIYAVIKGSATNNDGAVKTGFTAPSVDGQAEVITEALAVADVEPHTIQYVETHGTATRLGDAIEIEALSEVFAGAGVAPGACAIGSLKSNLGHLDTAAGAAGLIKTVLALKHGLLPPSIHFTRPNPELNLGNSPFYVNTSTQPWPTTPGQRGRAGVSSFGIGGTNAHVIVEAPPVLHATRSSRPWKLILLAARSEAALDRMSNNLADFIQNNQQVDLADLAYTLQVGRRAFPYRRTIVCHDYLDAISELRAPRPSGAALQPVAREAPVVFVFPGQGAQYVGMARDLYDTEPHFRTTFDRCASILQPLLHVDLRAIVYPAPDAVEQAAHELSQTRITQPTLFVIEYALADLLIQWGIRPAAMVGHSIGEYVAACLAGVLSLEDALTLVATRGSLIQSLQPGKMLAIALSEPEVRPMLDDQLSLAAVNSITSCVVSGPEQAILELNQRLQAQAVTTHLLDTSHAFHSTMQDSIVPAFAQAAAACRLQPPTMPYLSNVTGTWITAEQAQNPAYWADHLRQTVRFADSLDQLLSETTPLFLEVGPGNALGALIRQQAQTHSIALESLFSVLRHRKEQTSDARHLLGTLGQLWLHGVPIDWSAYYRDERRLRVPLPTYPFERKRYMVARTDGDRRESAPIARRDVADWFTLPTWERSAPPQVLARVVRDTPLQWLVLCDAYGLGEALVARLRRMGERVVAAYAGDSLRQLSADDYQIDPTSPADYATLIRNIGSIDRVIHAWSILPSPTAGDPLQRYEQVQHHAFHSILVLAQTLSDTAQAHPVAITVVSNNLQDVTGQLVHLPERATLYGACKVVPQEFAGISCRCVDLLFPDQQEGWVGQIDQLIQEFELSTTEFLVAYRQSQRWVRRFTELQLPAAQQSEHWRSGGTYLITGASNEIGLAFAQYVAERYQGRLALVGLPDFPAREQWPQWLADHDHDDSVSQHIHQLMALGDAGAADVLFVTADVTDEAQMRAVVAEVQQRFGAVHGWIHAADLRGAGLIQLKTIHTLQPVLDVKLKSTFLLEMLLPMHELDFVLLSASTTGLLGGFGQVDNCAVNAFLDAYAHARTSDRTPVIAIDWGQWQWDTWQERQMAGMPDVQSNLQQIRMTYGMSAAEGIAAAEQVLSSRLPQVIVSPLDFNLIAQEDVYSLTSFVQSVGEPAVLSDHAPDGSGSAVSGSEIDSTVAAVWQDILGVPRVGYEDNIFSLGGNSLFAIQIMARLRQIYDVDIPMTAIFEHPTVQGLAAVIRDLHMEQTTLDELEALLNDIENLSAAEINSKLLS